MPPLIPADPCACGGPITRRDFLKTTTSGVAALASATTQPWLNHALAAPTGRSESETLVTTLHKSLTEGQRAAVCFPFDHLLRLKIDNNWSITEQTVGEFFSTDQQVMIRDIFLKLHSPDYAE